MQTEPDLKIINQAKNGSLEAYNLIIEHHKASVFHLCQKLLKIKEEAEEVAQDVFVIIYKKIKGFEGKAKFTTWLYRITYNECVSRIRKNKRFEKYQEIEESEYQIGFVEQSYGSMDSNYQSQIIERSLDELDEESKTIILMYYYHDKNVEEISVITGLTNTNVKTKLFRARKSMLYFMEKKLKLSKSEILER